MLASYFVYFFLWLNEYATANIRIIACVRNFEKARKIFGEACSSSQLSIVQVDICASLGDVQELSGSIDYIIHAASLASPQYYVPQPVEVIAPNALGTYYLLRLGVEKQVKGFLYFSSGDVYGLMEDGTGAFDETAMGTLDPLATHSCYGESKRIGESWCAAFSREYGLHTVIARIAHTYAPTMDLKHDPRVFASFMRCLIEGENIVMLSDGTARRPFCYAADAVDAFLLLLRYGVSGEAYNLSNDDNFLSIAELAEMIASLDQTGKTKVVCRTRRAGENYLENVINKANRPVATKLRALGWQCHYDARAGFGRVERFFRERMSM